MADRVRGGRPQNWLGKANRPGESAQRFGAQHVLDVSRYRLRIFVQVGYFILIARTLGHAERITVRGGSTRQNGAIQ
jgi:hypothetical protein